MHEQVDNLDGIEQIIVDGRPWWMVEGRLLPVVRGGSDDADGDGDDDGDGQDDTDDDDGEDEGGADQARLKRIATRAADKARRKALREVSEQLGVSPDEAKKIIDAERKRQRDEMSEAEKAKVEADEARQRAEAAEARAIQRERDASIRAVLAERGVPAAKLAKAQRLVDLPDDDIDDEVIAAAVDELADDWPELFATPDDNEDDDEVEKRRRRAPSGDLPPNPGGKKRPKNTRSAMERGRERAKDKFGSREAAAS